MLINWLLFYSFVPDVLTYRSCKFSHYSSRCDNNYSKKMVTTSHYIATEAKVMLHDTKLEV